MAVQRIDQHMAVRAAEMLPEAIGPELRTRYRQLPVLLRSAGLAAAYAFVVSKGDDQDEIGRAYYAVAEGIRAHLVAQGLSAGDTPLQLLDNLARASADTYAYAAAEVRALAGWLSRLAEARFQAGQRA